MSEIGGYFELECGNTPPYHVGAVPLNSGRNAFRYIIRAHKIKKIHVPYYTCPVIWDVLREEACDFEFYHIDEELLPKVDFQEDDFVIYNNYFGVCTDKVKFLAQKYKFLIVDNAQSFFSQRMGMASFYSPRKFFGLPDGGLVISDKKTPPPPKGSLLIDVCRC